MAYQEKKEKEEPKKLDKEHESEGEKKHLEEENGCKKNSSKLRNAYRTACLNNTKSELQEQADKICDSIFNGIERAKELGMKNTYFKKHQKNLSKKEKSP